MYNKHLSYFIVLSLALSCLIAPALTTAQTAVRCGPQPWSLTCNPTPECEGILRKAFTPGCKRKNGKPVNDGGCQCRGYCGYKCATACQADPECRWNKSKKKCFNIATGKPGLPLKICSATNSPTNADFDPTLSPRVSLSPASQPTPPTTRSPTVAELCTREATFPGREYDPSTTVTFAFSSKGNVALLYDVTHINGTQVNETIPVVNVWITTRNSKNGKWNPKNVGKFENADHIRGASMNEDGSYFVFHTPSHHIRDPKAHPKDNRLVFLKRNANGKYKEMFSVRFKDLENVNAVTWMSAGGDRVVLSYYADEMKRDPSDHYLQTVRYTKTYVRKNDKWRLDWKQKDINLLIFSRNGQTAYSIEGKVYVLKNKKWVVQEPNLDPMVFPHNSYLPSPASSFSSNGKVFVMGIFNYMDPSNTGIVVFHREKGAWYRDTRVLGSTPLEGYFTGISDDLETLVMSYGYGVDSDENGFRVFKKNGHQNWTEQGSVWTNTSIGLMMNANGKRVVTLSPPVMWNC